MASLLATRVSRQITPSRLHDMHFCNNCQKTLPHRDPRPDQGVAFCTQCGSENRIPRVPLFVVTGSSGCGKSTVSQRLQQKLNPYFIIDADFLLHDIDGYGGSWDTFWNFVCIVSLTLARNLRPIVVVGRVLPSQIEKAKTSEFFSAVHYMILTCDPATQSKRLNERAVPGLLNVPAAEQIKGHVNGSLSMTDEARDRANATVMDNTQMIQDETASAVDRWILERLDSEHAAEPG